MTETAWGLLQLSDGVVDVWQADLAVGGERERSLLSPDEQERAARFVKRDDGLRWAHARGILRALLGIYGGVDPRGLRFGAGPHGKPALAGADGRLARVRFNLSHAGDVALYAFALDREVGVDIELPRARPFDMVAIAARTVGRAEAERLRALAPERREHEFLHLWVRWEAVLKCRGSGIGGADEAAGRPDPWLCDLAVDAPATAALAVEGGACTVRPGRWPPAVA